jgi:hypothetical protein
VKIGDGVDALVPIDVKSAPGSATLLPFVPVVLSTSPGEEMVTEFDRAEGIALLDKWRVVAREGNWHGKSEH